MDARRDRVGLVVAALVVVALLARGIALGDRPFSWTEGRVGYWTLKYLETGEFFYRPVAGGPLLYLATRHVFALLGASDATARLVPALIGGLLPAVALTFRSRLDPDETVLLAALLAVSPLLIYYSRVLRGDVPAAAFGLLVVGAAVRYRDTGARRWLYTAAAAFGAALAASGFGLLYVALWGVGGLLSLDTYRVRGDHQSVQSRLAAGRAWLLAEATPLARSLFVFLGVVVVLFAPRAGGAGPGLFNIGTLPAVIDRATFGAFDAFVGVYFGLRASAPSVYGHSLLPYLVGLGRTLIATAPAVTLLGVGGFLLERYRKESRRVVLFAGFTAGGGLLIIAIAAAVNRPWNAVHLIPWLAIPAAVGAARLARATRTAADEQDTARVVVVSLIAIAVVLQTGVTAAAVYESPSRGSPFAGFGQPADDLDPMANAAADAIRGNDGVDVLYVGGDLATSREYDRPPIAELDRASWGKRLPLQWYFERADASVDSVPSAEFLPEDPPPVVVTTAELQVDVGTRLSGYEAYELRLGLFDRTVVVFVEEG